MKKTFIALGVAAVITLGALCAKAHDSRYSTTEIEFTNSVEFTYANYSVYPKVYILEMIFPSGDNVSEGNFKIGNSNYLSTVTSWTNQTMSGAIFYLPQPYNTFNGCQITVTNAANVAAVLRIHQGF